MPMIDPKKNILQCICSLEKDDERGDTSQALLLLKTMGVFIWVHDTLEFISLWNLQQAMAMVDIAQQTTYIHENLQRIKVS